MECYLRSYICCSIILIGETILITFLFSRFINLSFIFFLYILVLFPLHTCTVAEARMCSHVEGLIKLYEREWEKYCLVAIGQKETEHFNFNKNWFFLSTVVDEARMFIYWLIRLWVREPECYWQDRDGTLFLILN